MVQKKSIEITVGLFIALGIAALLMLAMKVSNVAEYANSDSYQVQARFENIGGLKARSPVMMAGVRIGKVAGVTVDEKTFEAVVTLDLTMRFNNLPIDTSASIFTAGLLGEQYISLEPGGDMKALKQGDTIKLTQSALVLEQVIGQVLFSKAAGD